SSSLGTTSAIPAPVIAAATLTASEVCSHPGPSWHRPSNRLQPSPNPTHSPFSPTEGVYAHFSSHSATQLDRQCFDVIIGCDGRRNTFSRYFPRNNRRGKLAIGLTANFVNRRT